MKQPMLNSVRNPKPNVNQPMAKLVLCKFLEKFLKEISKCRFKNLLKVEIPFNTSKGMSSTLSKNKWPYFGRRSFASRNWYSWFLNVVLLFRSATQMEKGGVLSRSPKNKEK